jgi:hypothetical protein
MNYRKELSRATMNRVVLTLTSKEEADAALVSISDIMTAGGYMVSYADPLITTAACISIACTVFKLQNQGFIDACQEYGDTRFTIYVIKHMIPPTWFDVPRYGIVIDLDDDTVAVQLKLALL